MVKRLVPILLMAMVVILAATHGMFNIAMRKAMRVSGPALSDRTAISFRIDDSFTAKERVLILEALGEIRRASGCVELTASFARIPVGEMLTWRRDRDATIYKASRPSTWTYHASRYLAGPGVYMGIAMITTGDVFIMAAENDEGGVDFRNTVVHEVLHVVFRSGWHSPRGGSLMYHSIGGGKQKFLAEETAALRAMCASPKIHKVALHEVWVPRRHHDARPAAVPGATGRMVQ